MQKLISSAVLPLALLLVSCGERKTHSLSSNAEDTSNPKTECSNLSTSKIYEWRRTFQSNLDEAYPLYAKTKSIAAISEPTEKRILEAKIKQLEREMNQWQDAIDDMDQELKNRGLK